MKAGFLVGFVLFQFYVADKIAFGTCQVPSTHHDSSQVRDYYWRDYVGVIPEDAIQGGVDKMGNATYIGQIYFRNFELLPATIYRGCKSGRASAYNKEMQSDKNVKILCSKHPHKFTWIVTKNEETHLLTNCHFVVGGSEVGQTLNIGRVNHNGETIIGKVFSYPLGNRGLWIPCDGHECHFLSYELLTYDYCASAVCSDCIEPRFQ